jgi:DNA-binding NarL/FixJ family response regulator
VLIVSPQRLADGSILQLARLVRAESAQARIAVWADFAPQLIAPEEYAALIPRSASFAEFEDALSAILVSPAHSESPENVATKSLAETRSSATLSDRQLELLVLIAEGLSIKEIAQRWRLTNKSVDSLKYRLMKELDIHNRVDLARLAILEGLIDPRQIGSESA